MMKNNDYKNFDSLTLFVKESKVDEIVKHYKDFGWELIDKCENERYEDTIDLTFSRPHKINNKDEIQLRQVYMEEYLNALGKLDRHKHSKTTAIGLCMGSIIATLLVLGVWLLVAGNTTTTFVFGVVLLSLSLIFCVVEIFLLIKLFKKEKEYYIVESRRLEKEVNDICSKVRVLLGDDNGKN